MADAKSFRTKELSKMSVDELKKFVKDVQGAGIKGSKEVDKAINLLKVQQPSRYGAKTVESAKTSLQTQSSIPTLEKLGIAVPDWKKQQAGIATPVAGTTGTTGTAGGLSTGMTSTTGTSANPLVTPEVTAAQKEVDRITKLKNEELALINDNPFYSEGTRGGKAARLNEKYTQQIANAQNTLSMAQTNAQNAYKAQQDALANNRDILKTYISTGALAGASQSELSAISKATGYPMGVLQGAINQIKLDQQVKLTSGTKLTESERTSNIIKKVNNAFQGTDNGRPILGADGYASPTDFATLRNAFLALGGTLKEFNDNFYMYVNPDMWESYGISGSYFK